MKKLIKKSLAFCLVTMLVLTAFVGAFGVSAESATVKAGSIEVEAGATTVTVPVTITAADGFYAAYIQVTSDFGALTAVEVPADVDYNVNVDGYTAVDLATGKMLIMSIYGDDLRNNITSATVNCTFTATEAPAAGEYAVTVTLPDVPAADWSENVVALTATNGAITVKEAAPEGPVVDENLKFFKVSLAYGNSSLELNFRIANTVLDLYNNVEVVIIPQKYDMTNLNLVENPAEIVIAKANLAAAGSKYKQYTFTDIQLYELGLNIDYMLRGYDAEGNLVAVSNVATMSAAGYLSTMAADTTNAAGFRTLMVDTLVVCDEVMKVVANNYPNSNLAEAVAAGSVLDGVDKSLATQTIGECNTVDSFKSYDDAYGQTSAFTHRIRSSVAVGKVPYINFRIQDSKNALDLNKLAVTVNYTSKDKSGEHPYERTFTGSDFSDGTYINCVFGEVGFHDSDKDILFTVTYDGVKKCEWTYSIETYLNSQTSNATTGAQMAALIKLGQSFRSYQGL